MKGWGRNSAKMEAISEAHTYASICMGKRKVMILEQSIMYTL